MQKGINIFLTFLVLGILFYMAGQFIYGKGGKYDQLKNKINDIENRQKENNKEIEKELKEV